MPHQTGAADNPGVDQTAPEVPTRARPYTDALAEGVGRAAGLKAFTAKMAERLPAPSAAHVERARAIRARVSRGIGLTAQERQKALVSAAKSRLRSALD